MFWWFFLLFDTILLHAYNICALYPITFFHGGALLGLLTGLLEALLLPHKTRSEDLPRDPDDSDAVTRSVVEGTSESTPLLAEARRKVVRLKSEQNEKEAGGLWIIQYLLSVPFPVLLAAQTLLFAMHSLHQTLADGSSPTNGMTDTIFFTRVY